MKQRYSHWVFPALWGIMMYTVLRAVTDLTLQHGFWNGPMGSHIIALLLSVIICYLCIFLWIRVLRKKLPGLEQSNLRPGEYVVVFFELLAFLNLTLLIGQWTTILSMGAGIIDYMLVNVVYLPLMLLLYTLTRNTIVGNYFQEKLLLIERLKAEKLETELAYLKSQYHPHFLFNALNTVYFKINEDNSEARKTVAQLSDLLRYQIYDVHKKVTIGRELEYLRTYIEFQQLRKSKKLSVSISVDAGLGNQTVYPLIFLPLVENAFKHVNGAQIIEVKMNLKGNEIDFEIKNSVSPVEKTHDQQRSGIGIKNLKRQLELLYHHKHTLHVCEAEGFYVASMTVTLD